MSSKGAVSAAAASTRQRPGGNEVPVVGGNRRAPSQRRLERSALRRRYGVDVVTHGSEQLQQSRVVQPVLRLHAARVKPLEAAGGRVSGVEQ